MNREVKYRAWDGFNKKMSYWTMNDLCTWDNKEEKPSALDEWMQYTGLYDSRDAEVYKSDILLAPDQSKLIVIYETGRASFVTVHKGNITPQSLREWLDIGSVVIGNIYENPTLLSKEQSAK